MTDFIQTMLDALSVGGLYAVVAIGVALIFSVMRLVNFAHGALIMVGAYAIYLLSEHGLVLWVVSTLLVVVVFALLMERVAFRPMRGEDMSALLIASFAVNTIMQDTAILVFGSIPKAVVLPAFFTESVSFIGLTVSNLTLLTLGCTAAALAGLGVFLRKVPAGIQMRAAAEDLVMARLVGIKANTVIATAFALSGLLAALAAILLAAQAGTVSPSFGFEAVIIAFVATVIGGMGSLPGAALGGLVLGVLTTLLQKYLPESAVGYRDSLVYGAVIVILLVRPQGIMGSLERSA
jgi:branched-chain amino acid transport system permease protein